MEPEIDIMNHGDFLERTSYLFIRNRLPAYERIWKTYIGNDGTDKLTVIPELSPQENQRRETIAMYHYTVLESSICMKFIVEKADRIDKILNLDDYLSAMNDFIYFQAHGGRIRDNLNKLISKAAQDIRDIPKPDVNTLDSYWNQRNGILHEVKLPYKFDPELSQLQFPLSKPKSEDLEGSWSPASGWHDTTNVNFKYISDYLKESFNGLIAEVNNILSGLKPFIKKIVTDNNIKIFPPAILPNRLSTSSTLLANVSPSSESGHSSINGLGNGSGRVE